MNLSLIRSMTRSAVFELENGLCYRPAHPFTVTPVSYTHLDVYKRQMENCTSRMAGTPPMLS